MDKETINLTTEQRKRQLIESSEDSRKALEMHLQDLKTNSLRLGGMVLMAGATVFVSYKIVRALTKKKRTQKVVKADDSKYAMVAAKAEDNALARLVKQQIALFLIGMLKQKLTSSLARNKK